MPSIPLEVFADNQLLPSGTGPRAIQGTGTPVLAGGAQPGTNTGIEMPSGG